MDFIRSITGFLVLLASFEAVGQGRNCGEVSDFLTPPFNTVFNEHGTEGKVLQEINNGLEVLFAGDSTLQTYLPSELASISGKSGNYCVGDKVFAVSLDYLLGGFYDPNSEGVRRAINATSAIRGVYPKADVDGNVVVKGVYQDGTVVVELLDGKTKRVTTYSLAAKKGHTPDNALHVGDKIAWVGGKELTVRGIFENGDIAVSEDGSSSQAFKIPTSDVMVKQGQGRNGYTVGDTVSDFNNHLGKTVTGIVRAIPRKGEGDVLFVQMTSGYGFSMFDGPFWHRNLAIWPM